MHHTAKEVLICSVNIMNIGNPLYSALSKCLKERYLLLKELHPMVTVEDAEYSIELSQSYTGDLHLSVVSGVT